MQRTRGYNRYFDPVTGQFVSRSRSKRRARKVSGLGSLGSFGQSSSIKGMMSGMKGVLVTGAIAAGGAIITDQIFERVAGNWNIDGWKRHLAMMGTGIALGIVIAKLLKKPKLAAAFAIGPVVAGGIRLFADVMGPGSTAGLGLTAYTPVNAYESMYAPMYGTELGATTYQPAAGPGQMPLPDANGVNAFSAVM